jgi:hypothetical protein
MEWSSWEGSTLDLCAFRRDQQSVAGAGPWIRYFAPNRYLIKPVIVLEKSGA